MEWHKASVARQIITPREAYGSTTMGASGGNYGEPMEVSLVKTARSNTSALGKKIRKSKRVKQLIQNNFGEEFASLKQQLDQAVAGALASKYRNAGQTCICANRILVQSSIHDAFIDKFVAAVAKLELGDGLSDSSTLGPMISPRAATNVENMVADAVANGAAVALGGERALALGECFYPATILSNVSSDMRVFREEIFGPVAPVFRFEDEAQAIAMANDTEFGLAAYIYTQDMARIWRVSERIEYGMVGVNEVGITSEIIPFGGMKESGLGREGSKYGIEDYIETKYICIGGLGA